MHINLEEFAKEADRKHKDYHTLINRLKKKKPADLDEKVRMLHVKAFEKIDCLECANCCKSISPALYRGDVQRLASHLKIRENDFIAAYLFLDDDGAFGFTKTPCPFLMSDNHCLVYNHRPTACREYPHTDRRRQVQILNLTFKNSKICPAVLFVLDGLKEAYGW